MTEHNEQFDDKISALYKKGATETPRADINRHILQQAHQQNRSLIKDWLLKLIKPGDFAFPLATAAVIVIGLSLLLEIQFGHKDSLLPDSTAPQEMIAEEIAAPDQLHFETSRPEQLHSEKRQAPARAPAPAAPLSSQPLPAESPTIQRTLPAADDALQDAAPLLRQQQQRIEKKKAEQMTARQSEKMAKREAERKAKRELQSKQLESRSRAAPSVSLAAEPELDAVSELSKEDANEMSLDRYSSGLTANKENIVCEQLNAEQCFSSRVCTLEYKNRVYQCRPANGVCEQDFSQLENTAEQCNAKDGCQYQPGTCLCTDNQCDCENKPVPGCFSNKTNP